MVARDVDKDDIRILGGDHVGIGGKVVGGGQDHLGPLIDHILHHLLQRHALAVGRVELVKDEHLGARQVLFRVLPGTEMGLAPTVVVLRAHEDHAKDKLFLAGPASAGREQHEHKDKDDSQGSASTSLEHGRVSLPLQSDEPKCPRARQANDLSVCGGPPFPTRSGSSAIHKGATTHHAVAAAERRNSSTVARPCLTRLLRGCGKKVRRGLARRRMESDGSACQARSAGLPSPDVGF